MCDKRNIKKGRDNMAKNMEKADSNKKDKNLDLDKILAKGIARYDKTLKKLSRNWKNGKASSARTQIYSW